MAEIETLAVLADPVRRRLYDAVVAAGAGLSREGAAEAVGVPAHSARFHLDRLVAAGLLAVEERRLSGRTGPGAGRPAKVYRPTRATIAVSIPPRRYELVGEVLAGAVQRSLQGEDLATVLAEEARAIGRADGLRYAGVEGEVRAQERRASSALAERGFAPYATEAGIRLRNCPFDALAQEHTELVCGVNLDYVRGVVEGAGCQRLSAVLDPVDEHCCVRILREVAGSVADAR